MLKLIMPMEFGKDYKTFVRFIRIVETMGRYGFHDLAEKFYPKHKFRWMKRQKEMRRLSRPEKLRAMLEELGPTFVKLGQILSTRPDIISREYARELTKLTEQVAPFPAEKVIEIVTREFGKPPAELFAEFDLEPMAAASIGQVHGAKLPNGMEVVVKVRRPGIGKTIETDLSVMEYIAEKMEEYSESFARLEPTRIVSEFAYSIRRELNYRAEAANLLLFYKNMNGRPNTRVPELLVDYSGESVLTMERIRGDSVAKVLDDPEKAARYDLPFIAEVGVKSLMSQIFEFGFFHADPHPGNIFLQEENTLIFIDFGMMSRVSMAERQDFVKALDHLLHGEIPLLIDSALRMTITGKFAGSRDELERDASDLVDENINLPLEKISVAKILEQLLLLFEKYHMALKPNLYMMFKALITIEGIGRRFDPALKIVDLVKPFIRKQKLRSLSPRGHIRRFVDNFGENLSALENLPKQVGNMVSQFEDGQLLLRVEHHRLNDLEETLYVTGERVSRSLLVAALLMGSALMVVAKIPPYWGDIPVIGLIGFLVSGVLALIILVADHRSRGRFLKEKARRKREETKLQHK